MKANYDKTINTMFQELDKLMKENLPSGVYHQVFNRVNKLKAAMAKKFMERDQVLPDDTTTATDKIRYFLLEGGELSSHQACQLGKTSHGNQIITKLRRQGWPIYAYTEYTKETNHPYLVYWLDEDWRLKMTEGLRGGE